MDLEVGAHRVVERDALSLGPPHEPPLPRVPARGGAPQRVVVVGQVALEAQVLDLALRLDAGDAAVVVGLERRRRPAHVAPLDRAGEGDLGRAAVEAGPAPLVVRVVGVGGEDEDGGRRGGRLGSDDEERLRVGALPGGPVGQERDLVEARGPRGIDGEGERDRPVATDGVGVVGDRVLGATDALTPPDDDPVLADAGDLGREAGGPAAAPDLDDVAGAVALAIGEALDEGPVGEVLPHGPILAGPPRPRARSAASVGPRCGDHDLRRARSRGGGDDDGDRPARRARRHARSAPATTPLGRCGTSTSATTCWPSWMRAAGGRATGTRRPPSRPSSPATRARATAWRSPTAPMPWRRRWPRATSARATR